jgi:deoxyribodipyrimidine photo-lyase
LDLIIRKGLTSKVVDILIEQSGASSVYWNRRYEIENIETDTEIMSDLKKRGISVKSFNANLLSEPWSRLKQVITIKFLLHIGERQRNI